MIIDQDIVPPEHAAACIRALTTYAGDLLAGGVVIVTPERIRARTPKPSA